MNLDSIKLFIPSEAIRDVNLQGLILNEGRTATNEDIIYQEYKTPSSPGIGLKQVTYKIGKEEVTVELSAKILKGEYYKLINLDTIERVFFEINSSSPITFDPAKAIDTATVGKMDVTDNLHLTSSPEKYLIALNQVRLNDRYNVNDYRQPGNKGIVIQGKQKTFKERMIFYLKELDLNRDKALKNEPYFDTILQQHQGTLRCESNYTSLERIRTAAGTSSNHLKSILMSEEKPNLKLFEKVMQKETQIRLFLEMENGMYAGMGLRQIEQSRGRETIIRECNFDMSLIIDFIRRARGKGSNNSKAIREYRTQCYEMMESEGKIIKMSNSLIDEIRMKLAV